MRRRIKFGVPVLVDARKPAAFRLNVQDWTLIFNFSGQNVCADRRGVLYGKKELLEEMHPFRGVAVIRTVSFEKTTYAGIPKF